MRHLGELLRAGPESAYRRRVSAPCLPGATRAIGPASTGTRAWFHAPGLAAWSRPSLGPSTRERGCGRRIGRRSTRRHRWICDTRRGSARSRRCAPRRCSPVGTEMRMNASSTAREHLTRGLGGNGGAVVPQNHAQAESLSVLWSLCVSRSTRRNRDSRLPDSGCRVERAAPVFESAAAIVVTPSRDAGQAPAT